MLPYKKSTALGTQLWAQSLQSQQNSDNTLIVTCLILSIGCGELSYLEYLLKAFPCYCSVISCVVCLQSFVIDFPLETSSCLTY